MRLRNLFIGLALLSALTGSVRAAECDAAASRAGACLPHPAASWGGIVRSGPGKNYSKVASLSEGERVTLLEKSNILDNGFPWFRIRFRKHREGFMWGGILCGLGNPFPGTYQTCH